jgi:hypothetical protein
MLPFTASMHEEFVLPSFSPLSSHSDSSFNLSRLEARSWVHDPQSHRAMRCAYSFSFLRPGENRTDFSLFILPPSAFPVRNPPIFLIDHYSGCDTDALSSSVAVLVSIRPLKGMFSRLSSSFIVLTDSSHTHSPHYVTGMAVSCAFMFFAAFLIITLRLFVFPPTTLPPSPLTFPSTAFSSGKTNAATKPSATSTL